jgi:hypothetical protein
MLNLSFGVGAVGAGAGAAWRYGSNSKISVNVNKIIKKLLQFAPTKLCGSLGLWLCNTCTYLTCIIA